MTMITNLPQDLVEEILSRVPVTSLRRVRLTCKNWNTLFKDESFTKKHLAQQAIASQGELVAIALMNFSLYLMRINLQNNSDPSVKSIGKLISLNDSDKLDQVCHCDGLVLCVTEDYTRLVVWNPYSGQTRWIPVEHKSDHNRVATYGHALGYDKNNSCRTFKILRFVQRQSVHEIYELSSNSWRVLDITIDWKTDNNSYGLSLKGNTYWFAHEMLSSGDVSEFLICFDFTTERFGPRLHLPFEPYYEDPVILSSARDEQLAVLFQHWVTNEMEIWVTTKIEPNAVSWSKFLAVDMNTFSDFFPFYILGSFLIDEETRTAVVFDREKETASPTRHIAYIIGENGYNTEVDLGKRTRDRSGFPLAYSYVPSSVQINQPA